jgi:hypothetical protein
VDEIFAYGSEALQPLKIGKNLLFIQRGGRRVREIDWQDGISDDTKSDRTVLASHLLSPGNTIVDWSYEQAPNSTVWAVRTDGVMLALTYYKEQEVVAWSRHVTDGAFRSVATIPVNGGDQTWVVVERTINGQQVWQIEYFDYTLGTDSALTYYNPTTAISTVNGASVSHLIGKKADVIGDGGVLIDAASDSTEEIDGSDISLGKRCVSVEIGLPFDSVCVTVRPEIRSNEGTTQGIVKSLHDLTVRVIQTNALRINGKVVTTRGPYDYLDSGPPFVTGDLRVFSLGMTTTARLTIEQVEPFPAKIIGIFGTVDAGDS